MADYLVLRDGKQEGPYTEADVIQHVQTGHITAYDLCWREGLATWQPIAVEIPAAAQISALPRVITNAPNIQEQSTAPFFYISIPRLIIMSILSIGVFEVYWCYKNWRIIKEQTGRKVSPLWRGIFCVFFMHSLFREIHDNPQTNSVVTPKFKPIALAVGWIITSILMNVSGGLGGSGAVILGLLIPAYLFIVPVQSYVNAASKQLFPDKKQDPWSFGQVLCLGYGLVLWVVIIAASFIPQSAL